jgi:hypothetical protein
MSIDMQPSVVGRVIDGPHEHRNHFAFQIGILLRCVSCNQAGMRRLRVANRDHHVLAALRVMLLKTRYSVRELFGRIAEDQLCCWRTVAGDRRSARHVAT